LNLETTYLGLVLPSPLVASAGPLTRHVTGIRRLAAAGVGAVVLPSLFEEQIRREAERDAALAEAGSESFGEALSYLPAVI
jgi:dihydroorotate dehydrogenase (fumarate)